MAVISEGIVRSFLEMILAFLSHQIIQSTTIIRDLMPLAFLDCRLPDMVMNHSCIIASVLHVVFRNRGHEAHLVIAVKTWLLTGHSWNKWHDVSRLWRQKTQKYSFGHRLCCNLSEVQIWFWSMSQMKNLHLNGAHMLHMWEGRTETMFPSN
jgi:hypothetical protein